MIYFFAFIISCACIFFSNIYWPQYPVAWVFLILAIMLLGSKIRFRLKNLPDKRYSFLLVVTLLFITTLVPYPNNIGLILASTGILIIVFLHNKGTLGGVGFSLLITGLVLVVFSLINPIYYIYSSRFHELRGMNIFIGHLLDLMSINHAVDGSNLYIQSWPDVDWINTTLEKTGIYFSRFFFISCLILIALFGQKKVKTSVKVFVVMIVYFPVSIYSSFIPSRWESRYFLEPVGGDHQFYSTGTYTHEIHSI